MTYKRSTPEEIAARNARAYLGTQQQQQQALQQLKQWIENKPLKKSKDGY